MGALIAGKTNKATLAKPARLNLDAMLLSVMLSSFDIALVFRKPADLRCTLSVGPSRYLLV
jgi:hypothetical protein